LDRRKAEGFLTERVHVLEERVHLLLQASHRVAHLPELVRVLEVVGATVGSIEAGQVEVAASLARGLAIALDLSALALVATEQEQDVSFV
jgi:hypothetical protein